MIASLIPIFLLKDGPKTGLKLLNGQAYCAYCSRETLISKPIYFIIYGGRHLLRMGERTFSLG